MTSALLLYRAGRMLFLAMGAVFLVIWGGYEFLFALAQARHVCVRQMPLHRERLNQHAIGKYAYSRAASCYWGYAAYG